MKSWFKNSTLIEKIVVFVLVVVVFSFFYLLSFIGGSDIELMTALAKPVTELTIGKLIVLLLAIGLITR